MAGIPISGLPPIATPQVTDIFPAVQSGVTYQETVTQLATLLNATLTFLPLAGGMMSGAINMGGNQINNMADPTLAQDAATKHYVDAVASGIIILPAAAVATTANLTATYNNGASGVGATLTNSGAQAAFMVDGVSPAHNSIVLVKDQTATADNGIYTLTTVGSGASNWVLTRSTNYDTAGQIVPGTVVVINAGTVNAATTWIETATVTTIGTDPILFSLFNANIYALKGANADITSMSGLTGYLQEPLGVKDANGNIVNTFETNNVSAVNYVSLLNSPTATPVVVSAKGADVDIALQLKGKGFYGAEVQGTGTNDNAPSGFVGEYITSHIANASAVSYTSGNFTDLTFLDLTPGDWNVWGNIAFINGSSNAINCFAWISTTSSSIPESSLRTGINMSSATLSSDTSINAPMIRISTASTIPVYLTGYMASGTSYALSGTLSARRVR